MIRVTLNILWPCLTICNEIRYPGRGGYGYVDIRMPLRKCIVTSLGGELRPWSIDLIAVNLDRGIVGDSIVAPVITRHATVACVGLNVHTHDTASNGKTTLNHLMLYF